MAAVVVPGCPSCWPEGLRFVVLHVPRVWTALRGGLSALTGANARFLPSTQLKTDPQLLASNYITQSPGSILIIRSSSVSAASL